MPTPTPVTVTTIDIAQAIAAEMNAPAGGTVFELPFDCAWRMGVKVFTLSDLAKLQLSVIAIKQTRKRWTRGGTERTHRVHITFQAKLDPTAATYDADIESQARFVFQVDDYWLAAHKQIASGSWPAGWATKPNAFVMESEILAMNNPKADMEEGMFAALYELMLMERTMQ